MANRLTEIFIPIGAIVATFLVAAIEAWVAISLNAGGSIPPKALTSDFNGPTDPTEDLVGTGANLSVSIKTDTGTLNKLYFFRATLKNTGAAPILPADFFGDIRLVAQPPWAIVAIGRSTLLGSRDVSDTWTRVSDTEFSGPPTLLNSGDSLAATIYMTAPEEAVRSRRYDEPPPFAWKVRVANLPSITSAPNALAKIQSDMGPIYVHVFGWGVPFLLTTFALYLALLMFFAFRNGLGERRLWVVVPAIVVAGVVCLAGAEATNTFVFGVVPGWNLPVDKGANIPPILIYLAAVAALYAIDLRRISASKRLIGSVN